MDAWAVGDSAKQIVSDCNVIMKFLSYSERQNGIAPAELRWYQRHSKDTLAHMEQPQSPEPSETSIVTEESNRPSLSHIREIYDQTSMAASDLPHHAQKRLPFHVFCIKVRALSKSKQISLYMLIFNLLLNGYIFNSKHYS